MRKTIQQAMEDVPIDRPKEPAPPETFKCPRCGETISNEMAAMLEHINDSGCYAPGLIRSGWMRERNGPRAGETAKKPTLDEMDGNYDA